MVIVYKTREALHLPFNSLTQLWSDLHLSAFDDNLHGSLSLSNPTTRRSNETDGFARHIGIYHSLYHHNTNLSEVFQYIQGARFMTYQMSHNVVTCQHIDVGRVPQKNRSFRSKILPPIVYC